ncbi:MAG: hypothetical protein PF439_06610 [Helicobacteraceae bacterium]|jgi:predicted small secreted protein|nr:hypothetical protein [Helicobacteraceae bacterium]
MKKISTFIIVLFVVLMVSGCSDTWQGAKEDTTDSAQWSKDKLNDGAEYIEEKTEEVSCLCLSCQQSFITLTSKPFMTD